MNSQLIKELATKAGLQMCGCGCNMPTRQTARFAELIIQECLSIVDEVCDSANDPEWRILEHFGIDHGWRRLEKNNEENEDVYLDYLNKMERDRVDHFAK